MSIQRNVITFIMIQLICSWTCFAPACFAEEAAQATHVDLDLTSTEKTFAASSVLASATQATIDLTTGATRTVTPTDMLTASEMIAVRQVVNTGTQYLHVNDQGAATGGGFHLSYYAANGLNNLVIPENVRASQNAALMQTLNLTGNLTNSGTFNVFSSDAAITSATVNASNICNNANAVISSTLANLALNAVNNIVNAGTISSTGSVAMTAGGSITNSGIMQVMQNLSVQATSVINQAQMAATLGNINVATASLTNSGIMQALAGGLHITQLNDSGIILSNLNGALSGLDFTLVGNATFVPNAFGIINLISTSTGTGGTVVITSGSSGGGGVTLATGSGDLGSISSNSTIVNVGGTINLNSSSGSVGPISSSPVITVGGIVNLNSGSGSSGNNASIVPNATMSSDFNFTVDANLLTIGSSPGGQIIIVNSNAAGNQIAAGTTTDEPTVQRPATVETSNNIATYTATLTQASTTTNTVSESNFTSRTVISTDINAVTPMAIMQQLPLSIMSAPVTTSMINTLNNLNQVNFAPTTIMPGVPLTNTPTAPPSATPQASNPQSPYQPIAYTTGAPTYDAIDNSTRGLSEIQFDTCLIRHSGNSDITYGQAGSINFNSGEILVHSPKATVVNTGDYSLTIDPGTVVLITKEDQVLKVRVLYELHTNAVVITAGSNLIKLSVGQEAMLAEQPVHLQAASQKDSLGRRHVVEATLTNGHAMSRSEFSHVGLIEEAQVLSQLVRSKTPEDRQLSDKLIKMAACLLTITGGHGAYSDK